MEKEIKNIKAGQKFEIIDVTIFGFDKGCIVEALDNIENVKKRAGMFKWVGGFEPNDFDFKKTRLVQNVEDLKRFKGKIK